MDHKALQRHREAQIKQLPDAIGVYALADATNTVRYVGQTVDSIRARVQRHTTSARSDVIANRLIDPSEIAFVRAFPITNKDHVTLLETHLIHLFNDMSPVMNGKIPQRLVEASGIEVPAPLVIQIIPDVALALRQSPAYRMQKQLKLHAELTEYIITVKDNTDLRRSLKASLELLNKYTDEFLKI